ncbi:MAG: septum formation initiator family protein [Solirubrobacterales bacterium]
MASAAQSRYRARQPRYRARVAPRRAGQRGSRIRWDRFGRVVLVLVLFVVLASYVAPSLHVFESWRQSQGADARLAELKRENEELTRKAKALETDAAVIAEARKLGLVGVGEQAYVVDGVR